MKIWSATQIFPHPWERIAKAHWQLHPNPYFPGTITDTTERKVEEGRLVTTRLIHYPWNLPKWAKKVIGEESNKNIAIEEKSIADPSKRRFEIYTKILSLCEYVTIEKKVIYEPLEDNWQKTIAQEENTITVQGMPFKSFFEDQVRKTAEKDAEKEQKAINWAVDNMEDNEKPSLEELKSQTVKLRTKVEDKLIMNAIEAFEDLISKNKRNRR